MVDMLEGVILMPIITADLTNQASVANLVSANGIPIQPVAFVLEDIASSDKDASGLITKQELTSQLETRLKPELAFAFEQQGMPSDIAELLVGEGSTAKSVLKAAKELDD